LTEIHHIKRIIYRFYKENLSEKVDLPIDRVIKNVRTKFVRLAKTIGHEQVPAIYDEVVDDFYFKK
jgi:hypothetical protein